MECGIFLAPPALGRHVIRRQLRQLHSVGLVGFWQWRWVPELGQRQVPVPQTKRWPTLLHF